MSNQQQKPKQGSRWGSLLSGAVAGLESRLDTILAEDDHASAKSRASEESNQQVKPTPVAAVKAEDGSRASSRTRTNSRLQDRLAKAVVKGSDGPRSATPSEGPSRVTSPTLVADTTRTSIDSKLSEITQDVTLPQAVNESGASQGAADTGLGDVSSIPIVIEPNATGEEATSSPRPSYDSGISRPSLDLSESGHTVDPSPRVSSERDAASLSVELEQLRQQHAERKDEIHAHLERIDALQAKLQYLAKEASQSARQAAAEATDGTMEKKLAEKDEQIALLMEEGQKLSKKELTFANAVKNLRIKNAEETKRTIDVKQKLAKLENTIHETTERARRAENAEKQAQGKLTILSKIEKDVDALMNEREAARTTIAELRKQLAEADRKAEEAEKKAQSGALEAEQKTVKDLKEELENTKIEKKLADDRIKDQMREVKEETTRKEERAKVLEIELRGEITSLETKLEVLRTRSEDFTSSTTSDSQAKLLRQIETLQSQYAVARENWEALESSLTARVTALAKERDEIAKRESDIRRKAREVNTKSRRLEEELDEVRERARTLENDIETQKVQSSKLQARLDKAETELNDAREEFEKEKKIWDAELVQRIDEEKTKLRLEFASQPSPVDPGFLRAESPTASFSFRKSSQTDILGSLHGSRRNPPRNGSSELHQIITDGRPPIAKRPSAQPLRTPTESGVSSRQMSANSLSQLNGGSQSPSVHTIDPDDAPSTASPHRTIADMLSASTVNAGPSVQLVSSMSAAVRRLESEKAASKEELARLTSQRDEAREEVVSLMREVEEKRKLDIKVDSLERDLKEVQKRYEASLEMLGEKQEQVEELKNDVLDLKQMLREMAEEKAAK